jgi:glutaconyl-CoA/methylmalonyl-CoA decarboxylase subunit delta
MDADVNAAIAMAMYLYFQEVHDKESAVLTINRTSRSYSPWSSKIYGIRQYPR